MPDFDFQLDTPIARGMHEFFRRLELRLDLDRPLTVFLAGGMGGHLYTGKRVTIRVLSPVDLAVSKISRLADPDKEDIHDLVYAGLTSAAEIASRAEEALSCYIGNTSTLRFNIRDALEIAESAERERSAGPTSP